MNTRELESSLYERMNTLEEYNRRSIYQLAKELKSDLKESSIGWILYRFVKEGKCQRIGRNLYVKSDLNHFKSSFIYSLSEEALSLNVEIQNTYPLITYTIFESSVLNQFLNHQRNQNIIVLDVEREFVSVIFEHIRDKNKHMVLMKPIKDLLETYLFNEPIVITNLISESPINRRNKHLCSGEKICVDLLRNSVYENLLSKSEINGIIAEIERNYLIDKNKLYRYAKRRKADKEIMKIIS